MLNASSGTERPGATARVSCWRHQGSCSLCGDAGIPGLSTAPPPHTTGCLALRRPPPPESTAPWAQAIATALSTLALVCFGAALWITAFPTASS